MQDPPPPQLSADSGKSPIADKELFVADEAGFADRIFVDKLNAVIAFKDYIQSTGHQIDRNLLTDLSQLFYLFELDVRERLYVLGREPLKSNPNTKAPSSEVWQNAPTKS